MASHKTKSSARLTDLQLDDIVVRRAAIGDYSTHVTADIDALISEIGALRQWIEALTAERDNARLVVDHLRNVAEHESGRIQLKTPESALAATTAVERSDALLDDAGMVRVGTQPERVKRLIQQRDQLATDALSALNAAGIATPDRGYVVFPFDLKSDIRRLAKQRNSARKWAVQWKKVAKIEHRDSDASQRSQNEAMRYIDTLREFRVAIHVLWEANAAFDALAVNGVYPEEPAKLNAALRVIWEAKARVKAADEAVLLGRGK